MTFAKCLPAIAAASFLLTVTTPVRAQSSVQECQSRIVLIQLDLDAIFNAGRVGGNSPQQTYASLSAKLQGAATKLNQHKNADAQIKLQDFRTAVVALRDAAKPKLSESDAGLLLDGADPARDWFDEGVNGAIVCVALLP